MWARRAKSQPFVERFADALVSRFFAGSARLFDGPSKIERRLPILPSSREATLIEDLKESLAFHRLTLGQPRQEELM